LAALAGIVGAIASITIVVPARAQEAQPGPVPVSYLSVLDAGRGTFDASTGKLTLRGVAPRAVWFSDRPARATGTSAIPELIGRFFEGNDPAPPNAALVFQGHPAESDVSIVELSDPKYDPRKRQLAFTANILEDPTTGLRTDSALADFVRKHDGKITKSFGPTTVFIDSATSDASTGDTDSACKPAGGNNVDTGHYTCTGKLDGTGRGDWIEVNCRQLPDGSRRSDGTPGTYNYVSRRPGDPATISDEPRIDDHGSDVSWFSHVQSSEEWQHIGSRLGTSIGITIDARGRNPAADWTFDVWCVNQTDNAWIVFG
jgi:hypothetical protein